MRHWTGIIINISITSFIRLPEVWTLVKWTVDWVISSAVGLAVLQADQSCESSSKSESWRATIPIWAIYSKLKGEKGERAKDWSVSRLKTAVDLGSFVPVGQSVQASGPSSNWVFYLSVFFVEGHFELALCLNEWSFNLQQQRLISA